MSPALIPAASMTLAGMASLAVPPGLSLIPGGSRAKELDFAPPPRAFLASRNDSEVLEMLRYAGVRYRSPDSAAAAVGIRVFEEGRELARHGPHSAITFDWDHTLSNYQIFEDVSKLIRVRSSKVAPPRELAETPMVAIETARPFLQELAFGTMVGFALRQGLKSLDEWENYKPQVGVATHTWPDRLAVLATHFMPILPLMEGLLPGSPRMYEKFTDGSARSVIHLHHFLHYAEVMMLLFDSQEFRQFTPAERESAMNYLEDGKAHYRKPIGAWAMRGWETSSLLHIDDSTTVVSDLLRQSEPGGYVRAIHVPHPHSRFFRNVQEWHKISLPALWRKREDAIRGVIKNLARKESFGSPLPALLGALGVDSEEVAWPRAGLPEGVVMMFHETPTTLGEFWNYYVEPTNRLKTLIHDVRKRHGGLRNIRRDYRAAVASFLLPAGASKDPP